MDIIDGDGNTLLHLAAKNDNARMLIDLRDWGKYKCTWIEIHHFLLRRFMLH